MKKFALAAALAASMVMPAIAFAADTAAAPAMTTTTTTTAAPTAAALAPAAAPATTTTTTTTTASMMKVELKDGSWAQIDADNSVKVSKDGGKTWTPAPDGTWEAKNGARITTRGGKKETM